MTAAVVLIDLQNDYLADQGLQPPAGEVASCAARLIQQARRRSLLVVHCITTVRLEPDARMAHWKRDGIWKCVDGSAGHASPKALAAAQDEPVFHKTHFSAFEDAGLDAYLKSHGVETVILAGVHLHACVRATALDAARLGYAVRIADDAVSSNDPLHAAITRRYLEARAFVFAPVSHVLDPLTPRTTPARIDVRTAREAFSGWAARPLAARVGVLQRLAAALSSESDALATLMASEVGKPISQGRGEVARAIALIQPAIEQASALRDLQCKDGTMIRHRPVGVVAAITPWNNPVAIPIGKIAPALAFGNTVAWKPAPAAEGVSRLLMKVFERAGIPVGCVTLVLGDRTAALALIDDPEVDAVTISGSLSSGFATRDACARRQIPLQAELGGNNVALVWNDADLTDAASRIAEGAFGFAGQRCTANRRVVVERSISESLLAQLVTATRALVWGDPHNPATQIGPMVSAHSADRVRALIERTQASGARILTPHDDITLTGDVYVAPTIVVCDDSEAEIVAEESFGPVLVVQVAGDWEHAMTLCNGVRQGLAAALFSSSEARQARFLDEAQAGILKINRATADAGVEAPFGGWKASGVGPPEHGPGNAQFYTRLQSVYR